MNKKDLKKFKEHYLSLKNQILKSIQNRDLETDVDGDEVDIVQANAITEIASKLSKRDSEKLNKINNALQKIEEGLFGECESCGNDIGSRRLEILPGVEFCVGCAEEQESQLKRFNAVG